MKVGDTVRLRAGGGRLGRIISGSAQDGYDWVVAWLDTNLTKNHAEGDLIEVGAARRKGPGRAIAGEPARRRAAGGRR